MQELLTINTDLYRQLQKRKMSFDLFYSDFYKPIFIDQICKISNEALLKLTHQFGYIFTDREKDQIVGFYNLTNVRGDRQAPPCQGCNGQNHLKKYIDHAILRLPAFLEADKAYCDARIEAHTQIIVAEELNIEDDIITEITITKDEKRKTKRSK